MQDPAKNIQFGAYYLKHVQTSLDDSPVLATAAYNAGPGRAQRWRDTRPMEAAVYIESIPFAETRDYVKKVMSNAMYYAARFGQPSVLLKDRLGTVPARKTPAESDVRSRMLRWNSSSRAIRISIALYSRSKLIMKIERICILGGSGFVGTHLVSQLATRGLKVRVLSHRRETAKELILLPTVEVIEADVHDQQELIRHFRGMDAVINLVGILHERQGRPCRSTERSPWRFPESPHRTAAQGHPCLRRIGRAPPAAHERARRPSQLALGLPAFQGHRRSAGARGRHAAYRA